MIPCLLDVNVWLALLVGGHGHHAVARTWFDSFREPGRVFFCRSTQQGLLRLLCNRTVLTAYGQLPLTNAQAWDAYEALLADDRVDYRQSEPTGLEPIWREFGVRKTASHLLWMDVYLAAFAKAAGLQLVTTDRALLQFRGVDVLVLQDASSPGADPVSLS